jgi:hypothetical protein
MRLWWLSGGIGFSVSSVTKFNRETLTIDEGSPKKRKIEKALHFRALISVTLGRVPSNRLRRVP